MGLLARLFGKKEQPITATRPEKEESAPGQRDKPMAPDRPRRPESAPPKNDAPVVAGGSKQQGAGPSESDPLKRWKDSGKARAWVAAHHGHWNHQDWLALLDELKRSGFWPIQPEAVGAVLEELKREWSRRN